MTQDLKIGISDARSYRCCTGKVLLAIVAALFFSSVCVRSESHAVGAVPSDRKGYEVFKLPEQESRILLGQEEDGIEWRLQLNEPVQRDSISGSFEKAGIGLRFRGIKRGEEYQFTVLGLNGEPIYDLNRGRTSIRSSLLGERLVHEFELDFLGEARGDWQKGVESGLPEFLGVSIEGDASVAERLWLVPELSLLPLLSRVLGERLGYTGTAYPATLPLHVMALSVHKKFSGKRSLSTFPGLNKVTCEAYPFPQDNCWGMCGPGCTCWEWVCGDCCFHTGCAVHDDYCRMSLAHPYCNAFWWVPFEIGGGCYPNE